MSSNAAPSSPLLVRVEVSGEAATAAIAARVSLALKPGAILLLSGDLGAGKTAFARALIQAAQARFGAPEDVPSPSFTLVQTYDVGETEIWHADLYRLSDPDELIELGLDDVGPNAIQLVEWPENTGDNWPAHALWLRIEIAGPETRRLSLFGPAATNPDIIKAFDP